MPPEWDNYRGLYYDVSALGDLASAISAFLFSHDPVSEPMLITGPSGCGKTLLATAIASASRERQGRVHMAPAAECAAGLVAAVLKERSSKAYLREYLDCDVVILEEYDQLSDKPHTRQELWLGLIAPLLSNRRRVVVTCIQMPCDDALPVGTHIRLRPASLAVRLAYARTCCGHLQLEPDERLLAQVAKAHPLHAIRGILLGHQLQAQLTAEQ